MVIDQERCIGCDSCTVACKLENGSTGYLIQVETENATQKDTPAGQFPDLKMSFLPRLCNHCENPPCVDVCPVDALEKREDGPVILDQETCYGCEICIDACPYGAILLDKEKGKAEKCNLCVDRIDRGLEPFCVICCEGQAIHFGDLNDPESDVSKLMGKKGAFQLTPEEGTKPSIYYRPPKTPRRL